MVIAPPDSAYVKSPYCDVGIVDVEQVQFMLVVVASVVVLELFARPVVVLDTAVVVMLELV